MKDRALIEYLTKDFQSLPSEAKLSAAKALLPYVQHDASPEELLLAYLEHRPLYLTVAGKVSLKGKATFFSQSGRKGDAKVIYVSTNAVTLLCPSVYCSDLKEGELLDFALKLKSKAAQAIVKGRATVRKVLCRRRNCHVHLQLRMIRKKYLDQLREFIKLTVLSELSDSYWR